MFFEELTKAQKKEYIESVVLGKDFADKKISDISYQKVKIKDDNPETIYITFSLDDDYDDEQEFIEAEVTDFVADAAHVNFMASKLGLNYLNSMMEYAKNMHDYDMQNAVKSGIEYYVNHLSAQQTHLSDFEESFELAEAMLEQNECLTEKSHNYKQTTFDEAEKF